MRRPLLWNCPHFRSTPCAYQTRRSVDGKCSALDVISLTNSVVLGCSPSWFLISHAHQLLHFDHNGLKGEQLFLLIVGLINVCLSTYFRWLQLSGLWYLICMSLNVRSINLRWTDWKRSALGVRQKRNQNRLVARNHERNSPCIVAVDLLSFLQLRGRQLSVIFGIKRHITKLQLPLSEIMSNSKQASFQS